MMQEFADKLGVDAYGINRVVTDLRKDAGVNVEPKAGADVQVCTICSDAFSQRGL